MEIMLRYVDECPNWTDVDRHLQELRTEFADLVVHRHQVETPEEAERLGFLGSPTVIIDGVDPFADSEAPVGLSCRFYQTPDGPAGSPTLDQLRAAITAR